MKYAFLKCNSTYVYCTRIVYVHDQYFNDYVRIYVRKSQEKSFWKKNLEVKTLGEKSQFSEVRGQNVTGNKV